MRVYTYSIFMCDKIVDCICKKFELSNILPILLFCFGITASYNKHRNIISFQMVEFLLSASFEIITQ